jgi:hypothetical protein
MTAGPEVRCKGGNFKSALAALTRLEGELVRDHVIEACLPDVRKMLKAGPRAGTWYPVAWYRDWHRALNAIVNRKGISREVSREATRNDFSGMYKVFMAVFRPETVIVHAMRFWGLYFDGGTVTTQREGHGRILIQWTGCVGFDEHIFADVIGGAEAILETAGAEQVRAELLAGAKDGDDMASVRMHWR